MFDFDDDSHYEGQAAPRQTTEIVKHVAAVALAAGGVLLILGVASGRLDGLVQWAAYKSFGSLMNYLR